MAKHSLDKRVDQIENQFRDPENPLRWFMKSDGKYRCMKTGRTSDTLDDLRSGKEKAMIFDIINPEPDDDSG